MQALVNGGLNSTFSEKEMKELGVYVPAVEMKPSDILEIRKQTNLSQTVFAKLLNVNPSSVRQWEQGKRKPTGATKVLLELLKREPTVLNYRLRSTISP